MTLDDDLDIWGTCCAIEAIESCDTSHWPAGARAMLQHAVDLAKVTRRLHERVEAVEGELEGMRAAIKAERAN